MLKCFICRAVHVPCQSLTFHLRVDHSFCPSTRLKLVCAQGHCRCPFSTYSDFQKPSVGSHEKDSCQSGDAARSESFPNNFQMLQDAPVGAEQSVMQNPVGVFRGQWIWSKKIQQILALQLLLNYSESVDLEELACGLSSEVKQQGLSAVSEDNPARAKV